MGEERSGGEGGSERGREEALEGEERERGGDREGEDWGDMDEKGV